MSLLERVSVLEKLVKIPYYWVLGTSSGEKVIYFSNESGAYSLWSLDRNAAKERLTKIPLQFLPENVAEPRKSSSKIFFARDVAKGEELHQIFYVDSNKPDSEEKLLAPTPPMRLLGLGMHTEKLVAFVGASKEEISIYFAGEGYFEKISKLDGLASLSDSNERYVVGSGFLKGNPKSEELFILDIATNEAKVFTPKEGSINKAPKLNGSRALFESNYEGSNQLYVYGIDTGNISCPRFASQDYDSHAPTENIHYGWFRPSEGTIWSVGKKNGEARAFVDGRLVQTPQGFIWGIAFAGTDMYYSHSGLTQPARVLRTRTEDNETVVVIDNPVPSEIKEKFGKVRFIKYKSFDGWEIPAFVVESAISPKPGPTVVYIHGGPTSEVPNSWSVLPASLVISGFHVIAPNYRGSTGYGEEYKVSNVGDLGGADLNDMVHAAKWAKEDNLAEKKKIAMVGYSYGGFSTLMALGKYPELWRCGVAGASIADWEEQYELSDAAFKTIIDILFNFKKELLRERSPITFVENIRAALCIIHSQNDSRTPLRPVLRYAMKIPKGVPFEMHIKPDLGHAISSVEDIMNLVEPAVGFLEKHLKEVS